MIKFLLLLLLLLSANPIVNADERTFGSINEFIATLPNGKLLEAHASGQLNDRGPTYHAQLVQLENYRIQQIFLFRVEDSGKYSLIDQSKEMDNMGGSGNWEMRKIEFRNFSLYISFGYLWHSCSGQSENQFRLVNDRLVMIGNESEEESVAKRLIVTSSTNLLNGKGYWISERNGVTKKHMDNSIKGVRPFFEYDGSGWISPYNTKRPVC